MHGIQGCSASIDDGIKRKRWARFQAENRRLSVTDFETLEKPERITLPASASDCRAILNRRESGLGSSGPRMPVGLQHFFESGQRGATLGELSFERTARGAIDVAQRFFVIGNDVLGILTTPIDNASVALAHDHAQVHRGPIDESSDAAGFFAGLLAFTAQTFALEIQFVGIVSASRFLLFEELNQVLFADIGGGSAITFRAVHADLDEAIQGFKFSHRDSPMVRNHLYFTAR